MSNVNESTSSIWPVLANAQNNEDLEVARPFSVWIIAVYNLLSSLLAGVALVLEINKTYLLPNGTAVEIISLYPYLGAFFVFVLIYNLFLWRGSKMVWLVYIATLTVGLPFLLYKTTTGIASIVGGVLTIVQLILLLLPQSRDYYTATKKQR
jgi:hypothetical protein